MRRWWWRVRPVVRRWGRPAVFSVAGALLALALFGSVGARIGPFDTTVAARPSISGFTLVRLSPLGTIELDSHDAPIAVDVRVEHLRLEEAERIAADPTVLEGLEDEAAADVRRALLLLAVKCVVVAVIGGALGAAVGAWRRTTVLAGALVGLVLTGATGAAAAVTFTPSSVGEPRYSGLLSVAPTAVGDLETVVGRFSEYRGQLTDLLANVVTLYRTAQDLPTFDADDGTVRVLHVSDIHLNPQAFDLVELLTEQFDVDVVADTGDLTDWGTEPESQLTERIGELDVPYVWVRGNHDSGTTQDAVAAQPNAHVLTGDAVTVAGLRFWGVADPRYTPDKNQPVGKDVEKERAEAMAPTVDRMVAVDQRTQPIDVVLVHDARMAADVAGDVPLVLSGHTHRAGSKRTDGTLFVTEGSTGGAGLRGLQKDEPEPLTATVLYFDAATRRLVAYDRITVNGLGQAGATIQRIVVRDPDRPLPNAPVTTSSTPSTTSTTAATTTTSSTVAAPPG